ncbi:MAG TPA: ATP-binding protein [Polyangiaceae bacterium]|nr:ATP-binding protein [Polyangiaceae bacterium]
MLLVAPGSAASVDPILSELAANEAWREEQSATIVWFVELPRSETAETAPSERTSALPQRPLARELSDAATLLRGGVYVVPVERRVWFEGSALRVVPRLPTDEPPLDRLLVTLAEAWGDRSVAVVAVALDQDGQQGLRMVRTVGGVAWHRPPLAKRAKSLASEQRERASAAAGRASALRASGAPDASGSPESSRDPGASRSPVSVRRGSEPPPSERSPRVLALAPHLLARIKAGGRGAARAQGGRLRVWVPGCKTGGTAYLAAMVLSDAVSDVAAPVPLSVHATDGDESALALARSGRYPVRAAIGMDADLRGRHTLDDGDTIRISEKIRRVCRFSTHDLLRDPPLARIDLVVCQGVFDAMLPEARRELVEMLHFAIRHGGLLLSLDRVDALPEQLFERTAQGLFRARPGPAGPALQRRLALAARSEGMRTPFPDEGPPSAGAVEFILQGIGLPLVACDDQLRVSFVSLEARSTFRLSTRDVGGPLAALTSRLPAGANLLAAAKRVLDHPKPEELTIRAGRRTYLVRIFPTRSGARAGLSLVFTDVTPLSDARAVAMAQRLQHAALARVSEVALSSATLGELCEEALGALFGNISPCVAGLVVEIVGPSSELRVLGSRGLSHEPLPPEGEAVTLVRAAIEQRCIVSSRGGHGVLDPALATGIGAPSEKSRLDALALLESGIGCPISAGDEPLGVIALFGRRPSIADRDHQHFIQAIANVLGGAMLRHRTRRRIQLELEVSRALSSAIDISHVHAGLVDAFAHTLAASWVELWGKSHDAGEPWCRLTAPRCGEPSRAWPEELISPTQSEVVVCSNGHGNELLVPIRRSGQVEHVLRLGGQHLLLPDRELLEGLGGVSRLLCEFLERERVLAAARRSEAAHRQKSAELEALYASLPVGVSIHDAHGVVRRANAQLAALETPAGTASAEPLKRLYAEQLPVWIARVFARGDDVRNIELDVRQDNERWVWLCNLAPIRGPDGEVQSVSVAVQDITPLKRIESALRETDRQKDDFLAMLGHELRNPMAAIRNATELLGRLVELSPQISRLHGIFDRQTLHTTQLIDGLLDVARVARGKIDLALAAVDLVRVVRQVVDDRRQQFKERVLDLRLSDGELWVHADRVRLVQILDNLLSNALKFTRPGGRIGIALTERDGLGSLFIEDDGAGIEPELLPSIFEPFRQGQATRAQSQGLGLGLALVKGLVDLHGFYLVASSPGPGQGARFRIDMPVSLAPESSPPASRVDSRPLDLVLVEDESDIADTLHELLQGLGHRVERCASAEEALALLGSHHPDVVLCDIGLPGMDGVELAARLRADPASKDLPLIAMTGFGDASTGARIEQAGFDRRLIKPVQLSVLQECLARLSARSSRESDADGRG